MCAPSNKLRQKDTAGPLIYSLSEVEKDVTVESINDS